MSAMLLKVVNLLPRRVLNLRFLSRLAKDKDIFSEKLYKMQEAKNSKVKQEMLTANPDPLSPSKLLLKSGLYSFVAATIVCIGVGAYDPGFRRILRTSYPYAALWLDLLMEKEVQEEDVVIDKSESVKVASDHRENLSQKLSPFKDELRSGMTEVILETAAGTK